MATFEMLFIGILSGCSWLRTKSYREHNGGVGYTTGELIFGSSGK
jgi:hypothetical protein